MITDNFLRLSGSLTAGTATGQAVTATANSTNVIDLSLARDVGEGDDLYVSFSVGTAFTAAGAATLTPTVVVSAADTLTTPTTLGTGGTIAVASLVAGYTFVIRVNPQLFYSSTTNSSLGLRYLGVIYTVATGPMTAGTITADVVLDIQDGKKFYASGFLVT
tara:strand:- start:20 stop:505 length:486 start_codon:yes stop_codon:yes gene_type:complete